MQSASSRQQQNKASLHLNKGSRKDPKAHVEDGEDILAKPIPDRNKIEH